VKILSESTDETHVEVIVMEQAGAAAGAERVAKPVDPAGADTAKEIVGQLLQRMGIRCSVTSRATPEAIIVDVSGRDLECSSAGAARRCARCDHGPTCWPAAKIGPDQRVIVDVERLRQRRENTVREIAYRAARQVKVTGDRSPWTRCSRSSAGRSTWRWRATGRHDGEHRRGTGPAGRRRAAAQPAGGLTATAGVELIRRAIGLANAAADGAGDEDVDSERDRGGHPRRARGAELTRDRQVVSTCRRRSTRCPTACRPTTPR